MQGKHKIITIVAILLVLTIVFSSQFHLFANDWGTGITINTDALSFEYKGDYAKKDKLFLYNEGEVLDDTRYIVSWQPQGESVKIAAKVNFKFCPYFEDAWSPVPSFILGQYAWMVQYEDEPGHLVTIIDGVHNHINTNYVHIYSGQILSNINGLEYKTNAFADSSDNAFGSNTWTTCFDSSIHPSFRSLSTDTLVFTMKGNKVGAIKVYCVIEYAEWQYTFLTHGRYNGKNALLGLDWAYLPSGVGKVDVLGETAVRSEGVETTPETNRQYTVYVFEEGQTVKFTVDTMYSGKAIGENSKGWSLRLYDGTGKLRQTWAIDDDVRGYIAEYTIPSGAFVPGGENRWQIKLMNTLFDQSETEIFVVDSLKKTPGQTSIDTDSTQYNENTPITVTLTAQANPNGTGEISQFYVWVKYDSTTSTHYAFGPVYLNAYHRSGLTYYRTFTFTPTEGGKTVYIRAFAIDRDGRAGPNGDSSLKIKQVYGNYKITVHVVHNKQPIDRAKVQIGEIIQYTTMGDAVLWCKPGTYSLTVSKTGYNTYHGTVVVNADKTIQVELQTSLIPPQFNWAVILIALIAIGTAIYVGVEYGYKKGYFKRRR